MPVAEFYPRNFHFECEPCSKLNDTSISNVSIKFPSEVPYCPVCNNPMILSSFWMWTDRPHDWDDEQEVFTISYNFKGREEDEPTQD